MAQVPYPITGNTVDEIKPQVWNLIRELFEERIAGLEIGDVFADEGDVLSLQVGDLGGLEKTSNGLFIKAKSDGGLALSSQGIAIKCKANGGLASDSGGLYSTEAAAAAVSAAAAAASEAAAAVSAAAAAASEASAAVISATVDDLKSAIDLTAANVLGFIDKSYYLKNPTGELTSIANPSDYGSLGAATFNIENIAASRYDLAQGSATLDMGSIT